MQQATTAIILGHPHCPAGVSRTLQHALIIAPRGPARQPRSGRAGAERPVGTMRPGMTVTLPDGGRLEFPTERRATTPPAAIGPGLAKAAVAVKVDEVRDLARPLEDEDTIEIVTPAQRQRLPLRHAPLGVARDGRRRPAPAPGTKSASARRSRTASTTTSTPSRSRPRTLERIEAEMRKIVAENLPFVRHVVPRAEARERLRGARRDLQGRDHRRRSPRARRSRLPARRLHRPLPRAARRSAPATSRRSSCCRSPAPTGAATSATRCCSASTAPRSIAEGARRAPRSASRRRKRARPPHAGQELDLFRSTTLGARRSPLFLPKGAIVYNGSRTSSGAELRAPRLRAGLYAARLARPSCCETSRPLRHYKDNMSSAASSERPASWSSR